MRPIIFTMSFIFTFYGCIKDNNITAPTPEQILSVSALSDSIQYTFAIPKQTFGINDTLVATISAFNQAASPETLGVGPSQFSWFLKNDSGRTIMFGPIGAVPLYLIETVVNSHQSIELYYIHQPILDMSGAPVKAGTYVLTARLYPLSPFSLNVLIE
jgi:hypothetical protein